MRSPISAVVFVCLVLLAILTGISFWHAPAYERGVWIGLTAISNALSAALGAKFGLAMPRAAGEEEAGASSEVAAPDAGGEPSAANGAAEK